MISQSIRPINKLDYFLLFYFVGLSSMPIFIGDEFLIMGFLVTFFIFLKKNLKFDKFIFIYSGVFLTILFLQSFRDGILEITPIIGLILKIFFAYFTIRIIGSKFPLVFINIIYFFSVVSLVFYSLTLIIPSLFTSILDFFYENLQFLQLNDPGRKHVIFYTYDQNYEIRAYTGSDNNFMNRNAGPFWEPGGWGIFLIIALIFNTINSKKIFTKKNIIFIITILTTLSTGAYIILMIYLTFYFFLSVSSKYKYIVLFFAIIVSNFVFQNTYFLKEKLTYTVEESEFGGSAVYAPRTRLGSALVDINDFMANPYIGKGFFVSNRYSKKENEILRYRNNGLTNMLVEYGIIGFSFFFFVMYKSFRNYCYSENINPKFSFIFVFCLMAFGFSQMIFIKTFFIGLSFMFVYINQGPAQLFIKPNLKKIN